MMFCRKITNVCHKITNVAVNFPCDVRSQLFVVTFLWNNLLFFLVTVFSPQTASSEKLLWDGMNDEHGFVSTPDSGHKSDGGSVKHVTNAKPTGAPTGAPTSQGVI